MKKTTEYGADITGPAADRFTFAEGLRQNYRIGSLVAVSYLDRDTVRIVTVHRDAFAAAIARLPSTLHAFTWAPSTGQPAASEAIGNQGGQPAAAEVSAPLAALRAAVSGSGRAPIVEVSPAAVDAVDAVDMIDDAVLGHAIGMLTRAAAVLDTLRHFYVASAADEKRYAAKRAEAIANVHAALARIEP
jgi:hypothetical protein